MNRFALSFLAVLLMLSSCTTNYYLVVSDTDTPIYSGDANESLIATIPSNKSFILSDPYGKVKYGTISGYSPYAATWRKIVKLRKKKVRNLTFTRESGYTYNEVLSSSVRSVTKTKALFNITNTTFPYYLYIISFKEIKKDKLLVGHFNIFDLK